MTRPLTIATLLFTASTAGLLPLAAHAQTAAPSAVPRGAPTGAPSAAPTNASSVLLAQVQSIEKSLTGVATEMPADKYDFVPTEGAFRGVRSFAKQIKHSAAVHHLVAATLLGEPVTAEMSDERGPDAAKTKDEVLRYLADSFAALERAVATVDAGNAFTPIKGVFGSAPDTRVGLIIVAISHSSNHYGQVVEYLRMNGLTPPRNP